MFEVDSKKPVVENNSGHGERAFKMQTPPCPNGCGNDDVEPITKNNAPQVREMRDLFTRLDDAVKVQLYFCKRCMSLFVIKIKIENQSGEGEGDRLPLAA
jgi:hypothetical protein